MSVWDKLKVIAKAKFSDKSNLGDWYQKRLDICSQCPLNSANKRNKTAREIAIVTANLGKDSCLACGCEISAKASVRGEECGLVYKDMEPLWEKLPAITEHDFSSVKIENLSSDKVEVSIENKQVVIDYGTIKYNSDSSIELSITDADKTITELGVHAGCGCTTPKPYQKGDTFFTSIEYDTKRVGNFTKRLVFTVMRGTRETRFNGIIKGTVVKN